MVYLQFPSDLTAEELLLQAAYDKLKRKKKALQKLKTLNSKSEAERVQQVAKTNRSSDAREVAEKFIKSGVIAAIKSPKRPEQSFKRPRALERKLNSTETEKTVSSYQPFSATQAAKEEPLDRSKEPKAKRPKLKKLSETFVAPTDPADNVIGKPAAFVPNSKEGNTIFVYGYKLSYVFLEINFANFGNIVQIRMESDRTGYVMFEKPESAEEAIRQMDGMTVSSIKLKVTMAKIQPVLDPGKDSSSCFIWVSSYSPKNRNHRHKRDLQIYDNIFE